MGYVWNWSAHYEFWLWPIRARWKADSSHLFGQNGQNIIAEFGALVTEKSHGTRISRNEFLQPDPCNSVSLFIGNVKSLRPSQEHINRSQNVTITGVMLRKWTLKVHGHHLRGYIRYWHGLKGHFYGVIEPSCIHDKTNITCSACDMHICIWEIQF